MVTLLIVKSVPIIPTSATGAKEGFISPEVPAAGIANGALPQTVEGPVARIVIAKLLGMAKFRVQPLLAVALPQRVANPFPTSPTGIPPTTGVSPSLQNTSVRLAVSITVTVLSASVVRSTGTG